MKTLFMLISFSLLGLAQYDHNEARKSNNTFRKDTVEAYADYFKNLNLFLEEAHGEIARDISYELVRYFQAYYPDYISLEVPTFWAPSIVFDNPRYRGIIKQSSELSRAFLMDQGARNSLFFSDEFKKINELITNADEEFKNKLDEVFPNQNEVNDCIPLKHVAQDKDKVTYLEKHILDSMCLMDTFLDHKMNFEEQRFPLPTNLPLIFLGQEKRDQLYSGIEKVIQDFHFLDTNELLNEQKEKYQKKINQKRLEAFRSIHKTLSQKNLQEENIFYQVKREALKLEELLKDKKQIINKIYRELIDEATELAEKGVISIKEQDLGSVKRIRITSNKQKEQSAEVIIALNEWEVLREKLSRLMEYEDVIVKKMRDSSFEELRTMIDYMQADNRKERDELLIRISYAKDESDEKKIDKLIEDIDEVKRRTELTNLLITILNRLVFFTLPLEDREEITQALSLRQEEDVKNNVVRDFFGSIYTLTEEFAMFLYKPYSVSSKAKMAFDFLYSLNKAQDRIKLLMTSKDNFKKRPMSEEIKKLRKGEEPTFDYKPLNPYNCTVEAEAGNWFDGKTDYYFVIDGYVLHHTQDVGEMMLHIYDKFSKLYYYLGCRVNASKWSNWGRLTNQNYDHENIQAIEFMIKEEALPSYFHYIPTK